MIRTLLTALLLSSPMFAAEDPIGEKLDKAKTLYAQEMAAYRKKAEAWFETREDAARKSGIKKQVDQVKEERATFKRTDELPMKAPAELKKSSGDSRGKIVRAYEEAMKAHIRVKHDKEAETLEKELELVKLGVDLSDTRRRWVHDRGEFKIVKRGEWEELTPGNDRIRWQETERTNDYVEMTIVLGNKRHFARLSEGTDGRRSEIEKEYKPLFLGKWVK